MFTELRGHSLTQGFKEVSQQMLSRAMTRRNTSYKTFDGGWRQKAEDGGAQGGTQQSYFGLQKEGSWHRRKTPWDIQPGHTRFLRQGRKRGGSLACVRLHVVPAGGLCFYPPALFQTISDLYLRNLTSLHQRENDLGTIYTYRKINRERIFL